MTDYPLVEKPKVMEITHEVEELMNMDVRRDIIYSPKFAEFQVYQGYLNENEISAGLPSSPLQEFLRLWVASERYTLKGYLDSIPTVDVSESPLDIVSGNEIILFDAIGVDAFNIFKKKGIVLRFQNEISLYLDPYHFRSIPILGVKGGRAQGSVRIILPSKHGLPTFADDDIDLNYDLLPTMAKARAELSQLAISEGADKGMSAALLRSAVLICRKLGINDLIATTDDEVIYRVLNGKFGFDLPEVGNPSDYLGSSSTPIFIDIDKQLENSTRNSKIPQVAKFLAGQTNIEGFEWYVGK